MLYLDGIISVSLSISMGIKKKKREKEREREREKRTTRVLMVVSSLFFGNTHRVSGGKRVWRAEVRGGGMGGRGTSIFSLSVCFSPSLSLSLCVCFSLCLSST